LWFSKGQISAWASGARHGGVDLNLAVKRLQTHLVKLGFNIVLKLRGSIVAESELIFLQEVWNLKLKLLLPSKLLKRVLLKLLITPRRGRRSRKIHLTQKKRIVMMTVKMVKNRSMGRWKRKGEAGILLVEVKVRVLINPPVGVVALLRRIKVHSLPKGKPVKEEGPGSHHKFHSSPFKVEILFSLYRELYAMINWLLYLHFF
jgi:hypothetical protein